MGCIITLFLMPLLLLKWAIIFSIKFLKLMFYGIIGLIALILHIFGVDLPETNFEKQRYEFQGVRDELSKIDYLDGFEFEHYIANLLKELDYCDVQVSQATGDYGVDITATKNMIKYAFQCKRYSSTVGNDAVQEVVAGLAYYGCSKAVVVTNNYFTKNAKDLARSNNVELWDRDKLSQLIKKITIINKKSENVINNKTNIDQESQPKKGWLNYLLGTIVSLSLSLNIVMFITTNIDSTVWKFICSILSIILSFKVGFLLSDKSIEKHKKANRNKHDMNV